MKAGVSTSPWDVWKRPARAPVDGSSASRWNEKGIRGLRQRTRRGDPGSRSRRAGCPAGCCERSANNLRAQPPAGQEGEVRRVGGGISREERDGGIASGDPPQSAAATLAFAEWPLARCADRAVSGAHGRALTGSCLACPPRGSLVPPRARGTRCALPALPLPGATPAPLRSSLPPQSGHHESLEES